MPRTRELSLYRCIEPFAVYRDGVPVVYNADAEVLDDDPILNSHRSHFELASERVLKRSRVEQATAAPGELRAPVLPVHPPEGDHSHG